MTNDKKTNRYSHRLLVPVFTPPEKSDAHSIRYFILNEEPKEYICDQGCVHKYQTRNQDFTKPLPVYSPSDQYTEKLKRPTSPITAYKYKPSGKLMATIIKKHSPMSTGSYTCTSSEKLAEPSKPSRSPPRVSKVTSPNRLEKVSSPYNVSRPIPNVPRLKTLDRPIAPQVQDSTQTYPPKSISSGMRLLGTSPVSARPISSRRELDQDYQEKGPPSKVEEKEYDRNSDVWTRLYPYRVINKESQDRVNLNPKTMDWKNYHRLKTIYNFMDQLETTFPSMCTVGVIGQSVEGRNLKLLKISNGNASNVAIWIDSGIHAREWIGPAVNTYIANYIARNFNKLPYSCTNKDWFFAPVVNPDGYEFTHTNNRMWRKNKACHNGKCCGVDINRNFSVAWGGKGSSGDPEHSFFRGPHAFSEPEAQALKNVLMDAKLPFKVYITLHAYGEVIIFPYAHSDDLCPDYVRLLQGATVMSRAIYETNGTTYRVGISKDVMYRASGTSNDWCYGAVGIPYCYLIELRSKKHKFRLPEEEIKETGEEILNCVIALMDFVDKYPLEQISVINIWKDEPSTMDVMVEGSRVAQVAGLMHEREIPYSIAVSDINALLEKEQGCGIAKTFRRYFNNDSTMDWTRYHQLDTIYAFMDQLSREYPYLVTLETIGKTIEGRKMTLMKISNGNTGNPGVWVDGSIHPREWISTAVVTFIANTLVRTFHEQPSSVTNKDWYILPVLNPDGYEYTHTHDRMWRKNRAHYGECIGVDLNRNFSKGWGQNGEEGSSEDPGSVFYRGPKPFSEPESKAVRNAITKADCSFKVFLSLHSYGEVVIFPWGYTIDPCPDYVELLEGGTAMAKAIFQTSGRTYKVGSTKDLMYYAAGTSIDWAYSEALIPFSYMLELRSKKYRFLLPSSEIVETATEVLNGILRLMDFIDHRCKGTQSCICRK